MTLQNALASGFSAQQQTPDSVDPCINVTVEETESGFIAYVQKDGELADEGREFTDLADVNRIVPEMQIHSTRWYEV